MTKLGQAETVRVMLKMVEPRYSSDGSMYYTVEAYPWMGRGFRQWPFQPHPIIIGENPKNLADKLLTLQGHEVVLLMVPQKLGQNRDGTTKPDDGRLWNYWWDVIGMDGDKAPEPSPAQKETSATIEQPSAVDMPQDLHWSGITLTESDMAYQRRVSWGQALNLAQAILGPIGKMHEVEDEHFYVREIERWANGLYRIILRGPGHTPAADTPGLPLENARSAKKEPQDGPEHGDGADTELFESPPAPSTVSPQSPPRFKTLEAFWDAVEQRWPRVTKKFAVEQLGGHIGARLQHGATFDSLFQELEQRLWVQP